MTQTYSASGLAKLAGLFFAAALAFTGCTTVSDQSFSKVLQAEEQAKLHLLVLREGDIIKVSFPAMTTTSANLENTQQIRRDGKIVLALVGEVTAAGLTPEELQAKLSDLYAPQISSKEVVVTVQASAFPVYVIGAVAHGGKVMADHPLNALEAIMESGGFDFTTANTKKVKVIRNENGVMKNYTVNLKTILDGQDSQPFYLKPSDIVYVPERFSLF